MSHRPHTFVFLALAGLSVMILGASFLRLQAFEWPAVLLIVGVKCFLIGAVFTNLQKWSTPHRLSGVLTLLVLTVVLLFVLLDGWAVRSAALLSGARLEDGTLFLAMQ